MPPRVLIIILCYNGVELTLACLASLRQVTYQHADILVVDNASADQTAARVRAAFPAVQVIETGANLGFAAGNNVGLRAALAGGYEYALLLNNDTEVEPGFLERLVAAAEADPQIGMAGPTIVYHSRPDLVWSAGGQIDWRQGLSQMEGSLLPVAPQPGALRDVDFVTGCALLVRRAVLERAGLLDERFFMYYEETEWCVRVARSGFRIVHVPEARLSHKIPLDARADKPYVAYYMTRNRLLFLQATGAAFSTWLRVFFLQDLRTCVSLSLLPKWRERRNCRDAMLYAWHDFLQRRFGHREFA